MDFQLSKVGMSLAFLKNLNLKVYGSFLDLCEYTLVDRGRESSVLLYDQYRLLLFNFQITAMQNHFFLNCFICAFDSISKLVLQQ